MVPSPSRPDPAAATASAPERVREEEATRGPSLVHVYQWMALGLGVTGATGLYLWRRAELLFQIAYSPLMWVLLLVQIGMAVGLAGHAPRMPAPVAGAVLFLYAIVLGATLAPVVARHAGEPVGAAFFVAAAVFAGASLYGRWAPRALGQWRSFGAMALAGLLLATAVNAVRALYFGTARGWPGWLLTYAAVLLFVGLAAYEARRRRAPESAVPARPIQAAAQLYLDFVNVFVFLLRPLGRRRD
jgi:FtsH-binding integral membrane protein